MVPELFFPWKDEILNLIREPDNIWRLNQKLNTKSGAQSKYDLTTLHDEWKYIIDSIDKMNVQIKRIYGLDKFLSILQESEEIEQELNSLEEIKKYFSDLNQLNQANTQNQILNKLLKERDEISSLLEISKDEFQAIKLQYESYQQKESKIKTLFEQLNQQQRELYQKTNEITKKIDELDPILIRYQEKLDNIQDENDPDYTRIKSKLSVVEKEFKTLQETRKTLMRESKEIKKRILQERKSLKSLKQQINTIRPIYEEKSNEIKNLENRLNSIIDQIDKLSKEINQNQLKIKNGNSKYVKQKEFPTNNKYFGRPTELEQRIQFLKTNQEQLKQIIMKEFKNSKIVEIRRELEEKVNRFKKIFAQWEDESKIEEKLSKTMEISQIKIEKILNFKNWVNIFLHPIDFSCSVDFQLISDYHDLKIDIELYDKEGNSIKDIEALPRSTRSIIAFALIFAFYLSNNVYFILIRMSDLLPDIITKQTFQKTIAYFSNILDEIFQPEQLKIVFFLDTPTNYELNAIEVN